MACFLLAKKHFCDPVGINLYEFGLPTCPLLHQNRSFTNENKLSRTDADSAEHCSTVLSTEHQLPLSSALCSDSWSHAREVVGLTKQRSSWPGEQRGWTVQGRPQLCAASTRDNAFKHLSSKMHGNMKLRNERVSHIKCFSGVQLKRWVKRSCPY